MSAGSTNNLVMTVLILMINLIGSAGADSITIPLPIDGSDNSKPLSHYEILFIGNSHSSSNDLPDLVSALIEAGTADTTARSDLAPGWNYLVDRLNDGVTLKTLNSRSWTHVILQAQKYSSSGRYFYPTDAAEKWIRRVRNRNALPVLFPEWPRKGNTEEGPRVHQLHLDIASREPACVAPIGLAWEESIAQFPQLRLHAADGNHANLTGALLTAYVLYQVITLQDASLLPDLSDIGVDVDVQRNLRDIAASVVEQNHAECVGSRIKLDPEEFEFNVSATGESSTTTIAVSSSGNLPVTIQSITGPQEPFFLDPGSCARLPLTLFPAESCTLELKFEPRLEGLFLDSVALKTNHLSAPLVIDLSGYNGVVVPVLNRWGLMILALLLVGSVAILKKE